MKRQKLPKQVREAVRELFQRPEIQKAYKEAAAFFREQGSIGGKLGAKARMEKLTPEQRTAIAKHAVEVRERKRKERKKSQRKGKRPAGRE